MKIQQIGLMALLLATTAIPVEALEKSSVSHLLIKDAALDARRCHLDQRPHSHPPPPTRPSLPSIGQSGTRKMVGSFLGREVRTLTTSLRPALTTSLCRAVHSGFHLEVTL